MDISLVQFTIAESLKYCFVLGVQTAHVIGCVGELCWVYRLLRWYMEDTCRVCGRVILVYRLLRCYMEVTCTCSVCGRVMLGVQTAEVLYGGHMYM